MTGQLWTCQSDKWARWQRWRFWVLHRMNAAVWRGGWENKLLTGGENEKCNLDFSGMAFFNSASFLLFLLMFPLLFFLLYFFFLFLSPYPPASPTLPSWLLDTEREIHAAPHVSEKLIQLFRNKSEFTFLATVQQKPSTSGVILSIRELEHR